MARLFLSHASADNAAAVALNGWLAEQGFDDVFLDIDPTTGLAAGERWQEALRAAADRCEAVLFLVSPAWLASRWCLAEFLLAKTLHKRIFGLVIAPVALERLPLEMTGEWQLCDLTGGDQARGFDVPAAGGTVTIAFSDAGLGLLRRGLARAGLDGRSFPWPPQDDKRRAPYRGLKALEPQDAAIFFGRDAQIVRGMDQLRGLAEGGIGAVMVVLGASGAGKSSFLRAGLWPRLARADTEFLPLPVVRPEAAVLSGATGLAAALSAAFERLGGRRSLGDVRRALMEETSSLPGLLDDLLDMARRRLAIGPTGAADPAVVLPLDQAEELFAPEGAAEAGRFLTMLTPLLAPGAARRVLLVATIRSDRYEEMQATPALADVRWQLFDLRPMPPGEFKSVIEGPAQRASQAGASLTIAPALTARLMEEAQGADALPLLGFTLERLYRDYGSSGALTAAQYESVGGVRGVLEAAVQEALANPGAAPAIPADRAAQMALLRAAFIPNLARIDAESRSPRRRVAALAELAAEARPMVARLVAARLLVADRRDGVDVVEVAHESLLRNWPALKGWLEEDAADLTILEGVERSAADWAQHGRAEAWVDHRGARLAEATRVLARGDFGWRLDQVGVAYLASCRVQEAAAQAERRAAARRLLRRTQMGLAAALVLMAAAGVGAWFGFSGQEAFRRQFEIAEGRRLQNLALALKAEINPNIVEAVALRALPPRASRQSYRGARPVLLDRLLVAANGNAQRMVLEHADIVESCAFSRDGRRIVTGSVDKTARVWDAESGALLGILTGFDSTVHDAEFSGDGGRIVTISDDKTIRVWDGAKFDLLRTFAGNAYGGGGFSPDGRYIVAGAFDAPYATRVLDADSGEVAATLIGHKGRVSSARFSADGRRIVTASVDGTARVWDWHSGAVLATLVGQAVLYSARFSPDGNRVVTASEDHTVRVWDVPSGKAILTLTGTAAYNDASFSPDGRRIVTASDDATSRIWDAATGMPLGVFTGQDDSIDCASFSPDGRRVATDGSDAMVRVWDAQSGIMTARLAGHDGGVMTAAFSPDGKRLVTASTDQTAAVWNAQEGKVETTLPGHDGGMMSAAFSPDGRRIVTAEGYGKTRLWDARSGALLFAMQPGPQTWALDAAFSPDGKRIVTASENGTAQIWATGGDAQPVILKGHDGSVQTARFGPDGLHIVTAALDKTARIWDAASGAPVVRLAGHSGAVLGAVYRGDGRQIVTASDDKTARVWDAATGALLVTLTGHDMVVDGAAFSPDGRLIATASGDKTAGVWDAASGALLMVLGVHAAAVNAVAFSPDGHRVATASDDKTVGIWDLSDYVGPDDFAFIRATASHRVDGALRTRFALPDAPPPERAAAAIAVCERNKAYVSGASGTPAEVAAWAQAAQSGSGACNQRLAEQYGDGLRPGHDRELAFFHHALAARLLEAQGQDDAAQHERYRREAIAWILPRQRVEQLMDAADEWRPGEAFPR
jgi:WD40 repeat protein